MINDNIRTNRYDHQLLMCFFYGSNETKIPIAFYHYIIINK